jgi:hypothetical protein
VLLPSNAGLEALTKILFLLLKAVAVLLNVTQDVPKEVIEVLLAFK